MADFDFEIYEVDGIHGTLKELADYYNVDPISLSDLLLEGMSLPDAICMAEKGNNPGITKKRRPRVNVPESVDKVAKVDKPVDKVDIVDKPVDKVDKKVLERPCSGTAIEIKDKPVWTTNTISDVQEFDSYIVITTTTTTVYRKG